VFNRVERDDVSDGYKLVEPETELFRRMGNLEGCSADLQSQLSDSRGIKGTNIALGEVGGVQLDEMSRESDLYCQMKVNWLFRKGLLVSGTGRARDETWHQGRACPCSHGIGGMVGNVMTGLFAQASVAGFDGITAIPGGWFDHHLGTTGISGMC